LYDLCLWILLFLNVKVSDPGLFSLKKMALSGVTLGGWGNPWRVGVLLESRGTFGK